MQAGGEACEPRPTGPCVNVRGAVARAGREHRRHGMREERAMSEGETEGVRVNKTKSV